MTLWISAVRPACFDGVEIRPSISYRSAARKAWTMDWKSSGSEPPMSEEMMTHGFAMCSLFLDGQGDVGVCRRWHFVFGCLWRDETGWTRASLFLPSSRAPARGG